MQFQRNGRISGSRICPCPARRCPPLWGRLGIVEDKRFKVPVESTTTGLAFKSGSRAAFAFLQRCCPCNWPAWPPRKHLLYEPGSTARQHRTRLPQTRYKEPSTPRDCRLLLDARLAISRHLPPRHRFPAHVRANVTLPVSGLWSGLTRAHGGPSTDPGLYCALSEPCQH